MEFIILKTKTIAGHKIELQRGVRYWAGRPMASKGRKLFPINIRRMDENIPVLTIEDLNYDQANEFLAEFNNGPTSLEGRVW